MATPAALRKALVAEFGDRALDTQTAVLIDGKAKPAELRATFVAEFGTAATQSQTGQLLGFTQEER